MQPVTVSQRIESLDVLRGFALLGILLLNIIGFGLPSSAYSNPGVDLSGVFTLELGVWASVELFAEGAMRCLFSMLFGAGIVLFATGKSRFLHYKRTFWLLLFGLFDAYILLWQGDILVTYALAGAVLYWLRNVRPGRLLIIAGIFLLFMSALYSMIGYAMDIAHQASETLAQTEDPADISQELEETAGVWREFIRSYQQTDAAIARELAQRQDSYVTAFTWNVTKTNEMLLFVVPIFLFWDALTMMLIGMALYKYGVLQGQRSPGFYLKLMLLGFAIGLLVNGYEVTRAISNDLDLFSVFAQMQPTYHFGRLGMAMGYIGLFLWLTHQGVFTQLRNLLACVGRMALTNYLMQSLICLFIFTGAGFALVGELSRASLYLVVFGIWVFQLFFSQWWLARYQFGPVEWLWRLLTYGKRPQISK